MRRGFGAAGRALGARARARSLRGDARLCALATVQLEVHVLDLRDHRLVDLLVDADGRQRCEEVWVDGGSLGRCWRLRWNMPYLAHGRTTSTRGGVVPDGAREIAAHRGNVSCLAARVDLRRGESNQKWTKIMISAFRD